MPIIGVDNIREKVYRATDELFERYDIGYRESKDSLDPLRLMDYLSGPAKSAATLEHVRAIRQAIEINLRQKEDRRKRSLGSKILDIFTNRRENQVIDPVRPNPNILDQNLTLNSRVISGLVRVAGKSSYDPLPIRVTDSYLDGTLTVGEEDFELDPDKRLISVDLRFPRSDLIKFEQDIVYELSPDTGNIQVTKTNSYAPLISKVQIPFNPNHPNLYPVNMVFAINGLERQSGD